MWDYVKHPLRFLFGSSAQQYVNIEWVRRLKKQLKPDMMFIQEIDLNGKNDLPQIDLFCRGLLGRNTEMIPFTKYRDKGFHIGNWMSFYAVAAFGNHPTKCVRMTPKSHLLETTIDDLSILSIHLSLNKRHRKKQLQFIEGYINYNVQRRFIVIGDFNTSNLKELDSLTQTCDLHKVPLTATYTTNNPKRCYDLILYDNSIKMTHAEVLKDSCSDHLPIVFDFDFVDNEV